MPQHSPSSAADPARSSVGAHPPPPSALDHRVIGREMGIYTTHPLAGAGLPLWLPAGAIVRYELEQYAREIAPATGCSPVYSPVLGKRALQVCLLPVTAAHRATVDHAANLLRTNGVRTRLEAEGSLGSRIRAARGRRDSLLAVVRDDEVSVGAMSVDDPATDVRVRLPAAVLAERVVAAIRLRALREDLGAA